jgi:DNA invertase Pin-like site-specific DNA recombinase
VLDCVEHTSTDTASSKDAIPQLLNALLTFVCASDTAPAYRMDRFARNLADLHHIVQLLAQCGARIEFA